MKKHSIKLITLVTACLSLLLFTPAKAFEEGAVILSDPSIGATSTVTVSFQVGSAIQMAPDAMISVRFPSGFDVSQVGDSDGKPILGIDGGFSSQVNLGNNTVGFVRDGTGTMVTDTTCKYTISNVVNPTVAGLTDTFLLQLYTPTQASLAANTEAPGVVISEKMTLGGGSNHSKFCLVGTGSPIMALLFLLALVVAFHDKGLRRT